MRGCYNYKQWIDIKKKFWTLLNNDFWLDEIEDVCYLELLCHIYKATIALVG